jgi:hypothetical protein
MATINLPQQELDTNNRIGVVRLIMSLLRLEDKDGDLAILTNPEALPLAKSMWSTYATELGLVAADQIVLLGKNMQFVYLKSYVKFLRTPIYMKLVKNLYKIIEPLYKLLILQLKPKLSLLWVKT